MDIAKDIREILADSAHKVTKEWLDEAVAKYPYCTLPALLYLHHNQDREVN